MSAIKNNMKWILLSLISCLSGLYVPAQVVPTMEDSLGMIRHQDDSMIRAYRSATNEMMANHSARAMGRYWMPDYTRMSGSGVVTIGKDNAVAEWTKLFIDQPTISYIRTTDSVEVSENGNYAWESGKWIGINTKSKGGNYAAQWVKKDNIWKIQSEFFITLSTY